MHDRSDNAESRITVLASTMEQGKRNEFRILWGILAGSRMDKSERAPPFSIYADGFGFDFLKPGNEEAILFTIADGATLVKKF